MVALKKKLYELHPELLEMGKPEETLQYLILCLKEAWWQIPNSLIKTLITSMPRRLEAVRKAKERQTRY